MQAMLPQLVQVSSSQRVVQRQRAAPSRDLDPTTCARLQHIHLMTPMYNLHGTLLVLLCQRMYVICSVLPPPALYAGACTARARVFGVSLRSCSFSKLSSYDCVTCRFALVTLWPSATMISHLWRITIWQPPADWPSTQSIIKSMYACIIGPACSC